MSLEAIGTRALRLIDAERAHRLTIVFLRRRTPKKAEPDDPSLAQSLFGLDFPNPIGLAAGFDKDAEVMAQMLGYGFGFVEVGTITPQPQAGNPRPRVFRLPAERAVINRYGFNSKGLDAAEHNLRAFRASGGSGIVGVNVGKNKETADAGSDYVKGVARLGPHADYLVANVSSPNTPGLRALQGRAELSRLVEAIRAALPGSGPALLLKIAPDLTEPDMADIAAVAADGGLDGLIVSNTTIERPASLSSPHKGEGGGLSGPPLFDRSTAVLAEMYRLTDGAIPLIGVGGVGSGADAYAKIRAGASLVQLYTAMVYEGPGIVARIKRELIELLHRDGFRHISEAVGAG